MSRNRNIVTRWEQLAYGTRGQGSRLGDVVEGSGALLSGKVLVNRAARGRESRWALSASTLVVARARASPCTPKARSDPPEGRQRRRAGTGFAADRPRTRRGQVPRPAMTGHTLILEVLRGLLQRRLDEIQFSPLGSQIRHVVRAGRERRL
jgi:hypothetical protein